MSLIQLPETVLMVRPAHFQRNPQTLESNAFQVAIPEDDAQTIGRQAQDEFDAMVATLRSHGLAVVVLPDTETPVKPDAIFPNNWFSTHHDGTLIFYPMEAANRRLERRPELANTLSAEGFKVTQTIDLSEHEARGVHLEGTGSMVFDYPNQTVYGCISSRTDAKLFEDTAAKLGCRPVVFEAVDLQGTPIYHTNVLLTIGRDFAVICDEAIDNTLERAFVVSSLRDSGHAVISISYAQMNAFAGNMLEAQNKNGERLLILSRTAYDSLSEDQRQTLEARTTLVPVDIDTIERFGGGSARCMVAGIFLPKH